MRKKFFFIFMMTSLIANTCSAQEVRVEIQATADHAHFVVHKEEVDYQKLIARNAAACGVGLFCGYLFKNLWLDVGRANDYFWYKLLASMALCCAPDHFAKQLKADATASDVAAIAGAVFSFKYNL